jgi:CubicO group peptidase (beta-lactamase class C family)
VDRQVCVIPAAGGLWSTAADLVRFGRGWAGLLPAGLASEALRPQADRDPDGAQIGLGWLLHRPSGLCGHAGGGPGAAGSLLSGLSDGQTTVVLASRLVPIEPVNTRLARPIG